jgi:hypothetical protein
LAYLLLDKFQRRPVQRRSSTVTAGSMAAQTMVPAVQRKKIYCKTSAYQ